MKYQSTSTKGWDMYLVKIFRVISSRSRKCTTFLEPLFWLCIHGAMKRGARTRFSMVCVGGVLHGPAGACNTTKVAGSDTRWLWLWLCMCVHSHNHTHNHDSQTRPSNYVHACLHPRAAWIGLVGVLLARGPRARVRQGRAGTTMVVIVPHCDFDYCEILVFVKNQIISTQKTTKYRIYFLVYVILRFSVILWLWKIFWWLWDYFVTIKILVTIKKVRRDSTGARTR